MIRAVGVLVASGRDVRLIIAGEGPDRPRLHGIIRELGLDERVILLGHRTDMIELYEAMDVYVLSSVREGLPNVLLEAMALQTPVVATRVGGVPRLIEHGVSGLLVDPGSLDGLVASLDRAIQDVTLRESMRCAARRTIEERYSFARRMEKVKAIYDGLLDHGRRKPISGESRHAGQNLSAAN